MGNLGPGSGNGGVLMSESKPTDASIISLLASMAFHESVLAMREVRRKTVWNKPPPTGKERRAKAERKRKNKAASQSRRRNRGKK